MTPAQLDHLRAIDAHLDALLALAAKRTPGEWYAEIFPSIQDAQADGGFQWLGPKSPAFPGAVGYVWLRRDGLTGLPGCVEVSADNAAFIAACAGRAEAGWRATKAAIALCIANLHTDPEFATHGPDAICDNDGQGCRACGYTERILMDSILAAWPRELPTLP